jgi:UDP-N-acetylglucosamine--N-acetylmuramyl-(pentapeptide) pyrophosphoryl-undecaprenol N-acetylglucosamine transferase
MVPVLAGRRTGLPVFLHDSNAIPGKANRWAARFADTFFIGLEEAAAHLGKTRVEVTGTPVRAEFTSLPDRTTALDRFELTAGRKTLLVLGGSQGARALNRAAIAAIATFDPDTVQAILLTGTADHQATLDHLAAQAIPHLVHVLPFCSDMPAAYACADVALARAGASTLSELTIAGLPAILVPYPFAADDHQSANARAYTRRNAAKLLPEPAMDGPTLATLLHHLWDDPNTLSRMAGNMRNCAFPAAAETMADRIIATLQ